MTAKGFRLSPQQERIWLARNNLAPSSRVAACQVDLAGDICPERIEPVLTAAVQQYEIFRTGLQLFQGMSFPLQTIAENSPFALVQYDVKPLDVDSLAAELETIFRRYTKKCGEDECAGDSRSALRVGLVRHAPGKYVLVMALPSLYGDSSTLLHLVDRIVQGSIENTDLPQYADLAEGLQQFLSSEEFREVRTYWSIPRSPALAHPLPGYRVPESSQEFAAESIRYFVDADMLVSLDELAKKQSVPEAAVIIACWMLLISRFTGQWEMTVGLQCDGRLHEDLKQACGPLSRYVPLSLALHRRMPFCDFLQNVSAAMEECELHQEYYDPRNVPGPAQEPFFPFCFEFCDTRLAHTNPAVSVRFEKLISHLEGFAVKLQGMRRDSGMVLDLHYDVRSLDKRRMERMGSSLMALLDCVHRQPCTACGELDLLSAEEKYALVIAHNRTAQEYPRHSGLHELVEEQAFRHHEATAVIANGHRLTYGDLNDRAGRLASYLRKRRLAAGGVVGVYLPKSTGLVTSLLAVLKAGAAYVPLDIVYPADRIRYILQDAGIQLVITLESFASIFPDNVDVICLDRDENSIQRQSGANMGIRSTSGQLAYIIYTSGSTGRPKGVLIPHRAIVNYLSWCTTAYCMAASEGSIVTSTVAFDLTVTTLWGPLVVGKTAVLVTGEPAIEKLREVLLQPGPFVLKLTPAEMGLAQHFLEPGNCAGAVGAVVIGGEALYGEMLNFWRERAPGTRFINEYGPTETTVGCCVYEVPSGKCADGAVPIGRPIANTAIHVLNEDLQPAPVGVAGEIYIGGDCVGHGYCNQPAATAERFLPDPLSGVPGGRMYQTGDLARWGESGQVEYLGRNDSQVKIRGYRVELAEVEAELRKSTCVKDAAVVARGDSAANRHLAAYVILRDRLQPQEHWVRDLRSHLLRVLPEYMIPSAFISLERLPLTSNGKVDRQALSLQRARRAEGACGIPESDVELSIAAIWKEVLSLDEVGVNDNFFEIGGHSLALFQVHWRLQSTLNPALTVVDLLANPTIQSLAQYLSGPELQEDKLLSLEERVTRKRAAVQRRKENAESGGQRSGQLL